MKITKKTISLILIINILLSSIIWLFIKPKEVQAASTVTMSSSYTQYVKSGISAFPESYQGYLEDLAELHPNWTFKAYYTGIDWSELTSTGGENKCLKNTIYFKSGTTLLDAKAICISNHYGDTNYYCASSGTVNFYLDPRNFLSEGSVFQFLDLSYDSSITKSVLQKAVASSFLNGSVAVSGKTYTYVDIILEAAEESNVSAMHIVATILQELGTGTKQSDGSYSLPNAVSGTYSGYTGYYNFFNYGATDGTTNGNTPTQKALIKAKSLGWTDPVTALKQGVKVVLANSYISAGQNTKYFYKFDVVGNEILTESAGKKTYDKSYFFSHQYMTNIQDPLSQAYTLFQNYNDYVTNFASSSLTFTIPVYNNMPSTAVTMPTSLTSSDGTLYYISANLSVNFRSGAGTSYSSYGSLYRGQIVAVTSTSNKSWYKVKVNKATTYSSSSKSWSSTTVTGYISSEYLTKLSSVSTNSIELDSTNSIAKVVPGTTLGTITSTYSSAVVKNSSGTKITTTSTTVGTGYTVTIDSKTYTIVMLGDVNGDSYVKASDYVLVKNHIMGTSTLKNANLNAADVNGDDSVKASDYILIKNHIMGTSSITL